MNCELNEASLSIQNRHAELADELLSLLRDIRAKNELLIRLIETDFMPNVKGLQEFLSAVTKDRRQDIEEIIYRASFPELCKSRPAPNHIVTHSIAEKGKRVHEKIVQYEAERSNNIGKIRDIVKQIRSLEITNAPQFNTKIYYVWGLIVPVFFIAGNIEMHLPRNLRWLVYASILGSLPLSWGIIRFAKVLHKRQSDKFKSMISPDLKKLQEEKKALEERNESLKKKSTDLNKKLEKYLDSAQNKCCDFLRKNGAVTFQERWKTAAIRHENQIQFIFDSWKQLTDLRNSFLDLEKCAEYFHVNIDRKIVHNTSKSKVRHDLLSVNTDSIDLKKQSWMSSSLQSMENEVGSFIRLAQNDILICDKCLGHDVLQIDEVLGSGNL